VARRGALERAPVRTELVRLLASGEHTNTALAERFGVAQPSIVEFKHRHAASIARQRERLDDLYAGITYADKVARVAELSDQVEYVADLMEAELEDDEAEFDEPRTGKPRKAGVNVSTAELLRTVQTALRNIAEEKGELPSRQTVQHEGGVSVRYEIVGVQLEDLT
jgi:hypothetical protein